MYLDEFLIKIGVDAIQASKINDVVNQLSKGANKLGENANEIANNLKKTIDNVADGTNKLDDSIDKTEKKTSSLKLGLLAVFAVSGLVARGLSNAFNSAIGKAEELYNRKDALFKISKQELIQARQYKDAMAKSALAIDSVKTKIALNLAPAITNIANGFNKWLLSNKDLIVNGIGSAIKFIGSMIQVVINAVRFVDKIISSTIGWKNALIVLGVAWTAFNRALLFSPIGLVVGAIAGLLLLIDDLMVYMDGGDSLFGEYWQPLIDGANAAWNVIKKFYNFLQTIWKLIGAIWRGDLDGISSYSKQIWSGIKNFVSDVFNSIVGFVSNAIKSVLMYFGLSEDKANRVVDAIGDVFKTITNLIVAPFKAAWNLISSLFNIWTDDSASFTGKIGKTFDAIADFILSPFKDGWEFVKSLFGVFGVDVDKVVDDIGKGFSKTYDDLVAPFKKVIDWIKDKFFGFINTVKDKFKMILGWIGIDIGGDDEFTEKDSENLNRNTKAAASVFSFGGDVNPNMPVARNGAITNRSTSVNQNVENNITVNTSDTSVGADQVGDILARSLKTATDNSKTAMGVN